jgi:hypothetical protein
MDELPTISQYRRRRSGRSTIPLMNHEILPGVLAVPPALAWALLVGWLISRRYPHALQLKPFKQRGVRLNLQQHIFRGVLAFGAAVGIFDWTDRWLRRRLYGEGSLDRFIIGGEIVAVLLAGIVFGLVEASVQAKRAF